MVTLLPTNATEPSPPPPLIQSTNEPSKNLDAMLAAAKSEFEQGHLDAAERILHKILDLDPTNQKALYYLGLVARQKYLQTHPDQPRATQPPEKLPVPAPFPRQNLKPKLTSAKVGHDRLLGE